jgi:hypothetical protein
LIFEIIAITVACLLEWVAVGAISLVISLYVCKKILNVEVDKSFWDLFKEIIFNKSKRED